MRKLLIIMLKYSAEAILWKYRPLIVVVTGSVGKTSTKEAIYCVLSEFYRCRKNTGNYNNELGVPLTIINSRTAGKNIFQWILIFTKSVLLFILPVPYPEVLILEVGSDRPGDLKYLMSFIKPQISVVTAVGPSHLQNFGNIENIAEEKSVVVSALGGSGIAVLNYDDERTQAMSVKHRGKSILYGFDQDADVSARDVTHKQSGLLFKIRNEGNSVPVRIPGVIGAPSVYSALAAIGVGLSLKIGLLDIVNSLKSFQSPPGRMKVLPGIKGAVIIDDTYNAAPASTLAAMESMCKLEGVRKIAILGDMAELGHYTESGHRRVGGKVADLKLDYLVVVGPKAKFISETAIRNGFSERRVLEFADATEARIPVQDLIRKGDLILVKGSRSMRMELIVREIMAEPEKADELLVH